MNFVFYTTFIDPFDGEEYVTSLEFPKTCKPFNVSDVPQNFTFLWLFERAASSEEAYFLVDVSKKECEKRGGVLIQSPDINKLASFLSARKIPFEKTGDVSFLVKTGVEFIEKLTLLQVCEQVVYVDTRAYEKGEFQKIDLAFPDEIVLNFFEKFVLDAMWVTREGNYVLTVHGETTSLLSFIRQVADKIKENELSFPEFVFTFPGGKKGDQTSHYATKAFQENWVLTDQDNVYIEKNSKRGNILWNNKKEKTKKFYNITFERWDEVENPLTDIIIDTSFGVIREYCMVYNIGFSFFNNVFTTHSNAVLVKQFLAGKRQFVYKPDNKNEQHLNITRIDIAEALKNVFHFNCLTFISCKNDITFGETRFTVYEEAEELREIIEDNAEDIFKIKKRKLATLLQKQRTIETRSSKKVKI